MLRPRGSLSHRALTMVLVLLLLAGTGVGLVAPEPGRAAAQTMSGDWDSSIQIQNLEGAEAFVVVEYYHQNGTPATSPQTLRIAANRSKLVTPGYGTDNDDNPTAKRTKMQVPEGFDGSVVISSDRQIGVVSTFTNASVTMADNYNGVAKGASTIYLPLAQRQRGSYEKWSTKYSVQNVSDATVVATVRFFGSNGAEVTGARKQLSIPAGGRAEVDGDTHSGLPLNWYGSAVIATGNAEHLVAVSVAQSSKLNGRPQAIIGFPGHLVENAARQLYAPLVQNENDGGTWWSGIQVMNISPVSTDIICEVATLVDGVFTYREISRRTNIAQYVAGNWLSPATNSGMKGLPKILAVRFTASNPEAKIVGLVNLNRRDRFTTGTRAGQATGAPVLGSGYRLFAGGTQKNFLPLLDFYNDGWWSGIDVMNVHPTASTSIQLKVDGQAVGSRITLRPGEGHNFVKASSYGLSSTSAFIGSASIEAASGGQIVTVLSRQRFVSGKENAVIYENVTLQP